MVHPKNVWYNSQTFSAAMTTATPHASSGAIDGGVIAGYRSPAGVRQIALLSRATPRTRYVKGFRYQRRP